MENARFVDMPDGQTVVYYQLDGDYLSSPSESEHAARVARERSLLLFQRMVTEPAPTKSRYEEMKQRREKKKNKT
jgi:hypothetical protein